ncbi:uncharacterized protein LOC123702740 isoform X2 [Colias croceus]|uniref:uncharacterized protein LOC123702740 isoform X1 n=1 Tax=Colias crocea TaxID=72248 RepID=UPI001E27B35F|nr:uncharacterized protein LOC123702740 isoform X1 [Colias croceus]XP_045506485.1 uncharacterized protein LOC123702740 isoform X2 [Colias croceus]
MKDYIVWALILSAVLALGNDKPEYVKGFLLGLSGRADDLTLMDFDTEEVRFKRSDDDYSDEGGFVPKQGNGNDDDFIANVQSCASGYARAPWGKCISCTEYVKKFRVQCPKS